MKVDGLSFNSDYDKVLGTITEREKQETLARGTLASETLAKLNIAAENLPQRCQQLLETITTLSPGIQSVDPESTSILLTEKITEEMAGNYEVLKLKQKNRELQAKIDRNKVAINDLRRELKEAKSSLAAKRVNPGNIQEHIRQLSLKVASYEESYEKSKVRFSKYSVPESLYPKSLDELVTQLVNLKAEESQLKEKVDEILFARNMRNTFNRLRM